MDRRRLTDVGPALVLAALGVVELLTSSTVEGPPAVLVAAALALTLPLAARRRAPLPVLVVTLVTIAASDIAYDIPDEVVFPMLSVVLAIYAAAAYPSDRLTLAAGLGVVAAFLLAFVLQDDPDDILFIAAMGAAPWIAGRVVHSRQRLATALAARTVELEHEREEKAKLAVAEERARIARELHDIVAHNLSVMVVQAGAERRELESVPGARAETAEVLETIERTGRTAMAEMRRLLGMLRRSDDELALAPQPSLEHLDVLVDQVRSAGMPVELRVEGERRPLPPGVDLSAYRIVQEALTNALKHAGPASARVTVRFRRDELEIEIADDGVGAVRGSNGRNGSSGHGLTGMRERVALFGGDLAAGGRAGGGYAVRARLPLAGGGG